MAFGPGKASAPQITTTALDNKIRRPSYFDRPYGFAFREALFQTEGMKQPLALVFYETLLPGSQLVNRLQDLNYRVQTVTYAEDLVSSAEVEMPLLVFADLAATRGNIRAAIAELRNNTLTQHIPVIGFSAGDETTAATAGATLVVGETAVLDHLPQILEQALQVE